MRIFGWEINRRDEWGFRGVCNAKGVVWVVLPQKHMNGFFAIIKQNCISCTCFLVKKKTQVAFSGVYLNRCPTTREVNSGPLSAILYKGCLPVYRI